MYIISNDKTATKEYCGEIINEAYKLISIAYLNKENHAEINKWMGIIINRKSELEGRRIQLKNAEVIKDHLLVNIRNFDDFFDEIAFLESTSIKSK